MNSSFHRLASFVNLGVGLSFIDPNGGLGAGVRVGDSFACLPAALDRQAVASFGRELLDAAQELYRSHPAPIPIGERREGEFSRVHYLAAFFDLWQGGRAHSSRTRLLWTREERPVPSLGGVHHGEGFNIVYVDGGTETQTVCIGKNYRGFLNELNQMRQISAVSPFQEGDEGSELSVGGTSHFWRKLLPSERETSTIWADVLGIAAALYLGDTDLYQEGFEIRLRKETRPVRVDDRGRPFVDGLSLPEIEALKPRGVRSRRTVRQEGVPESEVEISVERSQVYVRQRRARSEAGTATPWLAGAALAAKKAIDREMEEFQGSESEVKQAYLEREVSRMERGTDRLI